MKKWSRSLAQSPRLNGRRRMDNGCKCRHPIAIFYRRQLLISVCVDISSSAHSINRTHTIRLTLSRCFNSIARRWCEIEIGLVSQIGGEARSWRRPLRDASLSGSRLFTVRRCGSPASTSSSYELAWSPDPDRPDSALNQPDLEGAYARAGSQQAPSGFSRGASRSFASLRASSPFG